MNGVPHDVVIVGGGVAGCVAALRASSAGARVVVVDKVPSLRRSGDAGRGASFLTTYLDQGEDWDTPETYLDWYVTLADGLVDEAVVGPLAVEPLPDCLRLLASIGVPVRAADGSYDRVGRMWTPGPLTLRFEGGNLKPSLAAAVDAAEHVTIMGGWHVTNVLVQEGRAVGVAAFHVRTGEFLALPARSVILAAGSAERVLFNSPSENPFNTYHSPYHGATGFALASRAGALIASAEFIGTFLFPRGFAAGAMGPMLEAGGRLVNAHGEPSSSWAGPPALDFGWGDVGRSAGETASGRGPISIDCTHLGGAAQARLRADLDRDAPLFLPFLEQAGLRLTHDPIEFELFHSVWSATGSPKGVIVDPRGRTTVDGLFAAGDLATPAYALAGALTTGYVTGAAAAAAARDVDRMQLAPDVVAVERRRVMEPLERPGGGAWEPFERSLQRIMTDHVGRDRHAEGLRTAARAVAELCGRARDLGAASHHDLMRLHEARDIAEFDQLMIAAAQERTETRFGFLFGHRRTDHPEPDDEQWRAVAVTVSRDADEVVVGRRTMAPAWRRSQAHAASTRRV